MYLHELLEGHVSKLISERFETFEQRMFNEVVKLAPSYFQKPLLYALDGGKRVRPLILLFSSEVLGPPFLDPYPAAIAIELLHCESLIQDDIIDAESSRRRLEPFHLKYGLRLSLMSIDVLLSLLIKLLSRYRSKPSLVKIMLNEIERCVREMSEGMVFEDEVLRSKRGSLKRYLKLIRLKTAPIFRASAKIGAIIATEGKYGEEVRALSKYGELVGTAYQLRDDILDVERGETLPLKLSSLKDVEVFRKLSISMVEEAKEELTKLRPCQAREALEGLANVVIKRTF